MKKLLLSAIALTGLISFSFAQATPAKTTTAAKPKMEVVKKDAKQTTATPAKVVPITAKTPAVIKPAAVKPAAVKPVATTTAVPLKKDGTPDKRFKANQTTTGPVKKDGTPDKRFKTNKKG